MKFLIWFLCYLGAVIIQVLLAGAGVRLGAIPIVILFSGATALARAMCKSWDDKAETKRFQKFEKELAASGMSRFEFLESRLPKSSREFCQKHIQDTAVLENYFKQLVDNGTITYLQSRELLNGYDKLRREASAKEESQMKSAATALQEMIKEAPQPEPVKDTPKPEPVKVAPQPQKQQTPAAPVPRYVRLAGREERSGWSVYHYQFVTYDYEFILNFAQAVLDEADRLDSASRIVAQDQPEQDCTRALLDCGRKIRACNAFQAPNASVGICVTTRGMTAETSLWTNTNAITVMTPGDPGETAVSDYLNNVIHKTVQR